MWKAIKTTLLTYAILGLMIIPTDAKAGYDYSHQERVFGKAEKQITKENKLYQLREVFDGYLITTIDPKKNLILLQTWRGTKPVSEEDAAILSVLMAPTDLGRFLSNEFFYAPMDSRERRVLDIAFSDEKRGERARVLEYENITMMWIYEEHRVIEIFVADRKTFTSL